MQERFLQLLQVILLLIAGRWAPYWMGRLAIKWEKLDHKLYDRVTTWIIGLLSMIMLFLGMVVVSLCFRWVIYGN